MSGKVGRPRKDGVVGWTEKQVWQPVWNFAIAYLAMFIISGWLAWHVFTSILYDEQYSKSNPIVMIFVLLVFLSWVCVSTIYFFVVSFFNTERLKVVKE